MNVIDSTKQLRHEKITAGTVLIMQGKKNKALHILHSGLAELLSYTGDNNINPETIIKESTRVGLIRGECIYGILGLRDSEAYKKSVRTLTDCVISVVPISTDDIIKKLQSDMRLNLQVLRALIQRIDSSIFLFNNYKELWRRLATVADSIALSHDMPNPETQIP